MIQIIATSGGTLPYTYEITGQPVGFISTFNNLGQGFYNITVTDASGKEKAGTYGGSKVEGTTAKRSMNARLGDAKRGDTNRTKKVVEAGIRTEKAVTKTSTKPKTYARTGAAAGATPVIAKPKKNKGK